MLDGDILWIEICDYFTGVLNLATGEAAEAERRFYEMKYKIGRASCRERV